jgi:hypothetical protein
LDSLTKLHGASYRRKTGPGRGERGSRFVVISASNDLRSVNHDGPLVTCSGEVHRLDDHDLQVVVRDFRSVYVEEKVPPLDIASVGEINV